VSVNAAPDPVEPVARDFRIAVEEHDVAIGVQGHAAVHASHEPQIDLVA
jgi:hypothetical protein